MVGHQDTNRTELAGPRRAPAEGPELTKPAGDTPVLDERQDNQIPTPITPAPRTEQPQRRPTPADVAKPMPPAPRSLPPAASVPRPTASRDHPAATIPPPPTPTVAATPTVAPVTPSAPVTPNVPAIVHPVVPASGNPARWGRVDEDGTVYLRIADGERAVGCWRAGSPDEGLAHYARRFDDLLTEAELLSTRLTAGGGDPKHTLTSARQLRESLAEAAVVGDVAGLAAHLETLEAKASEVVNDARCVREASRAQAIVRKEALVEEAEHLANETTQWKQAGDRFKTILEEWRRIRGIDRKTDEQLWKRFSRARDGFNRRRGSHFADLDRQRATAKARKEELAAEAELLTESTDWGSTATRYKQLMADWKAAGRAQKDADDALWHRFRTAQEAFFSRRAEVFAERDAEFAANAARKEHLIAEAEHLDVNNPDAARAALRSIHERWENAGRVPRERIHELEGRLRAAEDQIRQGLERRWRRTDPEQDARVAQFRERVQQFEIQAAKARAAGDTRRAEQAEGQAEQWREWLATAERALQR